MFGPPEDVEGQCNAHLYIADDYGDNSATMRCQLSRGHDGVHQEKYTTTMGGKIVVTWEDDERPAKEAWRKECEESLKDEDEY